MKNTVEWIAGAKAYASLCFTGEVLIYAAIKNMLFGEASLSYSIIWQFLALAVIIPLLQMLCFSEAVFKKISYPVRVLLFSVKLLCTLAIFAFVFNWFPTDSPMAWVIFVGIVLGSELIIGIALEMYFRITGKQYTEKLEFYKEHHRS